MRAALDARPGGGAAVDPTAPAKGPGDTDPNEPAFTVRVRVTDAAGTRGEDRKVLFAYRDATLAPGWPRPLDGGGEASQRLWDVDGDNRLDVVQAGLERLRCAVLDRRGRPLASFNGGQPVHTRPLAGVHAGAPALRAPVSRRASRCARRRSATSTATARPRSSTPPASTSTRGSSTGRPPPASPCG